MAIQNKSIWHTPDIRPESEKIFVYKTDKGNTATSMLFENSGWNPILLPEFYDMDDFDKAERIIKWVYLDDLLGLETDFERTQKALDVAKNAINFAVDHNIINCVARGIDPRTDNTTVTLCNALEQIITLEQKDK